MTNPSSSAGDINGLVYNFVKRRNPRILAEMFPKEECKRLESQDHLYNGNSVVRLLREYRAMRKPNPRQSEKPREKPSKTDLVLYKYLIDRGQTAALAALFDEQRRNELRRRLNESNLVPFEVMLTFYKKRVLLVDKIGRHMQLWKCQMCKKTFKGNADKLRIHIGRHIGCSCPCVIDGCDFIANQPRTLGVHLLKTHVRPVDYLDQDEYYRFKQVSKNYLLVASKELEKYFPPQSFVGFSDRKVLDRSEMENSICRECGVEIKSANGRRAHVAVHLSLTYPCVVKECKYKGTVYQMKVHILQKHLKTIGKLDVEETQKYRKYRQSSMKAIKSKLTQFFDSKTEENNEEGDL